MRNFSAVAWGGQLLALLLCPSTFANPAPIVFGLPHSPIGGALIRVEHGNLLVNPGRAPEDFATPPSEAGDFGVSVQLGEADSGIFGALDTSSSLQSEGNYMVGHVYGQVNGRPNQPIGYLKCVTIDWNGSYDVWADFTPLGSRLATYEVYRGSKLLAVSRHAEAPIRVETYSELAPRANPFSKTPDGSIAAEVLLSFPRPIRLPGWAEESDRVDGDRIVIRPENVTALVDFASQVNLTAGGGEDRIVVTHERLGVFARGHRVLGDALLRAVGGNLLISPIDPATADESGVSISLDDLGHFRLDLQPVYLNPGAVLTGSAIARQGSGTTDFLGLVRVENENGVWRISADFSASTEALQVNVLRNQAIVESRDVPAAVTSVTSEPARISGFRATADAGLAPAGLSVRLDRLVSFIRADGSRVQGDEIQFRAAGPIGRNALTTFSMTWQEAGEVNITGETSPDEICLADYWPELVNPSFLKQYSGTAQNALVSLIRNGEALDSSTPATLRWIDAAFPPAADSASCTFRFAGGGWRVYQVKGDGFEWNAPAGITLLPEVLRVGQTFVASGSVLWNDAAAPEQWAALTATTLAQALESVAAPALDEPVPAVRLVTLTEINSPDGATLLTQSTTNWLAKGLGLVRFDEQSATPNGTASARRQELAAFVFVNSPFRNLAVNAGANVTLRADVVHSQNAGIQAWRREDQVLADPPGDGLFLRPARAVHSGAYAVEIGIRNQDILIASTVARFAHLDVQPFSESAGFWTAILSSSSELRATSLASDPFGNVFITGSFNGHLQIANERLQSARADMYLAKLDAAGQLLWIKQLGGPQEDRAHALSVDDAGSAYLAGTFTGTVSLGDTQLTSSSGRSDLLIAKIGAAGNVLWATSTTGSATEYCTGLSASSTGQISLLGGFHGGTLVTGPITLSNESWPYDLFVAQLDSQGQFIWARQFAADSSDDSYRGSVYPGGLVSDTAGGLYLSGGVDGSMALDAFPIKASGPHDVGFLAHLDAHREFTWAERAGSNARSPAPGANGSVYFTGEFVGTTKIADTRIYSRFNDEADSYLAHLNSSGDVLALKNSPHVPGYPSSILSADADGNVYFLGGFYGEVTYDGITFTQQYSGSTLLTKTDAKGRRIWDKQITGGYDTWPRALAIDPAGNLFVAGEFSESIVLGETKVALNTRANVYLCKLPQSSPAFITAQPGPARVEPGDAVIFSVSASGTPPFRYQWKKDGQIIPGANSAFYFIESASNADAGVYTVSIRNPGGIVESTGATLDLIVPSAGAVAFSVASSSIPESEPRALITVVRSGNISQAATVDCVTAPASATIGEDFWAVSVSLRFAAGETTKTVAVPIVDDLYAESAETIQLGLREPSPGLALGPVSSAVLTILDNDPPGPPILRTQPADRIVPVDGAASFFVDARGLAPLSFQWYKDSRRISGATNRIHTILAAQLGDAGSYTVEVSNPAGVTVSSAAQLTVQPPPAIVAQPETQVVAYGETLILRVGATSSYPLVTQVFARVSTGPQADWLTLDGSGDGILCISYDFKDTRDTLAVNLEPSYGAMIPVGSIATNGTGTVRFAFSGMPGARLTVATASEVTGGGDGWSYRIERITSPVRYRWLRDEYPILTTAGPVLELSFTQFSDAGTYTAIVSDPTGSTRSQTAAVTVTGPILRIRNLGTATALEAAAAFVQLDWKVPDYHLESSLDLAPPIWSDVENIFSGSLFPASERETYFRLRRTDHTGDD